MGDFIYTMLCNAMLTFLRNFQFSPAYLVERWLVYKQVMAGSQYCSKMIATRILVLIACFGSLNATWVRRSVGGSKCPVVTTKPDFEIEKYLGVWYEITKLPNIFQGNMYCVSATYTPRAEGGINVDNEGFATDGSPSGILVYAEQNDPTHPGTLDLFFPGRPAGDYLVLDTDYDQFALVFSCGNVGFFKIEFGWLLARTPTVSAEVMAKAKAGFEKYGINFGSFKPTKQDNCNYKL